MSIADVFLWENREHRSVADGLPWSFHSSCSKVFDEVIRLWLRLSVQCVHLFLHLLSAFLSCRRNKGALQRIPAQPSFTHLRFPCSEIPFHILFDTTYASVDIAEIAQLLRRRLPGATRRERTSQISSISAELRRSRLAHRYRTAQRCA